MTFLKAIDLSVSLAVVLVLATLVLWLTAQPVPEALLALTCLVVGFLYGSRASVPRPERLEGVDAPFIPEAGR